MTVRLQEINGPAVHCTVYAVWTTPRVCYSNSTPTV